MSDPKAEGPRWLSEWPDFSAALRDKLTRGALEYGDKSFSRDLTELLDELSEECLDQAGWGMMGWVRIRDMQKALAEAIEAAKAESRG